MSQRDETSEMEIMTTTTELGNYYIKDCKNDYDNNGNNNGDDNNTIIIIIILLNIIIIYILFIIIMIKIIVRQYHMHKYNNAIYDWQYYVQCRLVGAGQSGRRNLVKFIKEIGFS